MSSALSSKLRECCNSHLTVTFIPWFLVSFPRIIVDFNELNVNKISNHFFLGCFREVRDPP
jgi:hypothetical protein